MNPTVLHATVSKPPGAVDLTRYPGLVFAPRQHGEGIRFAHNGKPVAELTAMPDASNAMGLVGHIAARMGVPVADALDALKYLRDQGVL